MREIKKGKSWLLKKKMWIISFLLILCMVPSGALAYLFVTQWGTSGEGDGQFRAATGIAVDHQGNVYVVDEGYHRTQKFTSNGEFITKWGSWGLGDGQFITPQSIAVDPQGNVYVTDASPWIRKFTSNGEFLEKWGGQSGNGDGEFLGFHRGIAVDYSGYVYVVDTGNNRVQKFTSDGVFITKWGTEGIGNGQFRNPQAIAADSGGNIYVADYNRIQKFSSSGTYLGMLLSEGTGDEGFVSAEGIAADGGGNVYVAERSKDRIQKFSSDGTFIEKWDVRGNGEGEFNWPRGVAVDFGGYVYILDRDSRVQKFAPPPVAPTACFNAEPTSGLAPLVVQFDSCSTGSPDLYSWDFGDGGTSTAVKPSHEYTNAGIYTVSLTVTNDYGGDTASRTGYITVESANRPPILDPIGAKSVDEGTALTFPVTATDPDNDPFTIRATEVPEGAVFYDGIFSWTPTYAQSGEYDVTFTVSDGLFEASEEIIITVNNVNLLPVAEAGPDQTVIIGEKVNFDGSKSTDPDGTILSFIWNYGDGNTGTGDKTAHIYQNAGVFTSSLTTTDNNGGSNTDTAKITVKSQSEAIQDIMSYIRSLQLKQGTEKSLIAKLEAAIKSIEKGNNGAAKNQMNACMNEINAQKGKAIPNDQAAILIAKIQNVINYL